MHFLAALDRTNTLRCVLGLHENIVTGAADGYARMAQKPAATLLHLGPGLANGIANLHNASRANSPIINIVGEHATDHIQNDPPLASDIEGLARTVSDWIKTSMTSHDVADDAVEAIRQANVYPGNISTLILPADVAWGRGTDPLSAPPATDTPAPPGRKIEQAAKALRDGEPSALYLSGKVVCGSGIELAGKIAVKTGAKLYIAPTASRIDWGAGRVAVKRLPYIIDQALSDLAPLKHLICFGPPEPVAAFAYPDKPRRLSPERCKIQQVTAPEEDEVQALEMLVDALGAHKTKL